MGPQVSRTTEGVRMLESRYRPAPARRLTSGDAGAADARYASDSDSAAVIIPEVLPPQPGDRRQQPTETISAFAVTFAPGSTSLGIESVSIAVGVRTCGALSSTEKASPRSVFHGHHAVAVSAAYQDTTSRSESKVSFTDDGCYVVSPHTTHERRSRTNAGSRLRRSA